ncbi:MAG: single-stranded DNA-binding protein [Caldilineaceae bacterium]
MTLVRIEVKPRMALIHANRKKREIIMFQQLILVGHLGGDPEMRYTSTGVPVTNFNLAVSRRRSTPEGETQEKTTWFRISLWRRQAEIASEYLTKGAKVMVIGEIENARAWTDRDGNLQATVEVTANQFRFLDNRNSADGGSVTPEEMGDRAEGDKEDLPF